MKPTDEQLHALDLYRKGESMVVEAGAGTGKTSTVRLLAYANQRHGIYLAFNRAIVNDVSTRLPERVVAKTNHSLAFAAVGRHYAHRLESPRMKSNEVAVRLGVKPIHVRVDGLHSKTLAAGYLAGLVMRSIGRYCQSTDELPGPEHVPYLNGIDLPDSHGQRTYTNNDLLRAHLTPALNLAWADITNPDGSLRFAHDHYFKMWALTRPMLPFDVVFLDEAQDTDPVLAEVLAHQPHAQVVAVGDEAQAIYEWRGAVNAMQGFDADADARAALTQSFRFGPVIAERANVFLAQLGTDLRLRGLPTIDSVRGRCDDPKAVLTRTNALAMATMLASIKRGRAAHLVGGGKEVVAFVEGARALQAGELCTHPELACFDTWGEVQLFVSQDALGHELRLLVELVDEFGAERVLDALVNQPPEDQADVVVSTAHKAKGREWPSVKIASDFTMCDDDPPEWRLRYVACTRARVHLDDEALDHKPADQPRLLDLAELDDDDEEAT